MVGRRIGLQGNWTPRNITGYLRDNVENLSALVRRHLFLHLKPEKFRDTFQPADYRREDWARLDRRNRGKPLFWHYDYPGEKDFEVLLCPRQNEWVVPTGFVHPEELQRAGKRILQGKHITEYQDSIRNAIANVVEGEVSQRSRREVRILLRDTCYHLADEHSSFSARAFIRCLNGQLRNVYWHAWMPGDCLLFGERALHAPFVPDRTFKGDGGTLYQNLIEGISA